MTNVSTVKFDPMINTENSAEIFGPPNKRSISNYPSFPKGQSAPLPFKTHPGADWLRSTVAK
jgi:hypothetical protein